MASILLPVPDIALVSDPAGTLVPIPHLLRADTDDRGDGASVAFYGAARPTHYRGTHRASTVSCLSRWTDREHAELLAFTGLVESSWDAIDGRLMLRTNGGLAAGFDDVYVGVVTSLPRTRLLGMAYDVAFTLELVDYTPEV